MPEISLSMPAIGMLNALLNDPQRLMPNVVPNPVKPYPVADSLVSLELLSIIRWLQTKVLVIGPDGRVGKLAPWAGTLNKRTRQRLQSVCKHYESWGLMSHNCSAFLALTYALDGKSVEAELVDVEKE